jgi:hypothetical protein
VVSSRRGAVLEQQTAADNGVLRIVKLVIAGLGKSGTTALFYKLLETFEEPPLTLFEPVEYRPVSADRHILAKVLIDPPGKVNFASFASFDRKIHIVRDPRDNLISRLLYRPYNRVDFVSNESHVRKFLARLQDKENCPARHSVLSLIKYYDALIGTDSLQRLCEHPTTALSFTRDHPEYFTIHYEDVVRGILAELSRYIGLPLAPATAVVAAAQKRVGRSKGYGDWKHWFTQEDVDYFHKIHQPYLDAYGYSPDWELASNQQISAENSAQYVLNLVNERRSTLALPPLSPAATVNT